MFMRYLGGGIGHQNQSARWTSTIEDKHDQMNIDPPSSCDEGSKIDEDPTNDTRLQGLRDLAIELGSRPAGDDDEDLDSEEDDSDDSSQEYGAGEDLFFDEDEGDDDEDKDIDFGPYDEEKDEDDTGFGDF